MNLTDDDPRASFHIVDVIVHPPLSTMWTLIVLVAVFAWLFVLDARTDATAVTHLYYLPIIFAAVRFGGRGAIVSAVTATLCYHLANHAGLWDFHYRESEMLRIAVFIAVGVIADRQATYTRRLHQLAMTDDLTGLHNLRAFEQRLTQALRIAWDGGLPLAMMVLDVDRLKSLNDVHGHLAGAEAVQNVGHVLAMRLPPEAVACRYGGDEFAIALPFYARSDALRVAEELCRQVNAIEPVLAGIPFPRATLSISVGLATWRRDPDAPPNGRFDAGTTGRALFHAADAALYAAKTGGRNRVYAEAARR
jgi:diguanylate cyclase (GGDEF)-like protein